MRMCNYVDDDVIAQIFITVFENTVDDDWVEKALQPFNKDKIKYLSHKKFR